MADNLKQNYNGSMLFTLTVSGWLVILAGSGLVASMGCEMSSEWWETGVELSNIMCIFKRNMHPVSSIDDPEIWKPLLHRRSLVLNGDVWAMLPEVFVCCCLMAISLLTFVIAANTPGNTNPRPGSQSAARDAAVMTNHSTAWWHCPSVHHTYILSRFALVLIFSHTSSSSWAFTTRLMQQIEFSKQFSYFLRAENNWEEGCEIFRPDQDIK